MEEHAMPNGSPQRPDLVDEYKDVSENMRHYANMRFAQLTLFFALTGGFLSKVLDSEHPVSSSLQVFLETGGLLASAAFWIMEERAADYWHHFRRRASELETVLGLFQHRTRVPRKVFSATNAVRMLFVAVIFFWMSALILPAWVGL
jgi:hypothetical protein